MTRILAALMLVAIGELVRSALPEHRGTAVALLGPVAAACVVLVIVG